MEVELAGQRVADLVDDRELGVRWSRSRPAGAWSRRTGGRSRARLAMLDASGAQEPLRRLVDRRAWPPAMTLSRGRVRMDAQPGLRLAAVVGAWHFGPYRASRKGPPCRPRSRPARPGRASSTVPEAERPPDPDHRARSGPDRSAIGWLAIAPAVLDLVRERRSCSLGCVVESRSDIELRVEQLRIRSPTSSMIACEVELAGERVADLVDDGELGVALPGLFERPNPAEGRCRRADPRTPAGRGQPACRSPTPSTPGPRARRASGRPPTAERPASRHRP